MAPIVQTVTEPVWLGEGPHWDHAEQVLYFVSVPDSTVNKYVPSTGKHTKAKLSELPSFIIPVDGKKNHFVVGMNHEVVEIEWDGRENTAKVVRSVAEVDQDKPKNKLNDAKADPRGRLFTGTTGQHYQNLQYEPKMGSLFRIDADGSVHKLDTGITCSNGLCFDVKEKAFYYVDSMEYTIRRYDYDVDTGNVSNPRNVFVYKEHGVNGFADGMTIDTDGNLWVANFDGHQVIKIDPRTNSLLQKIPMPVPQVTSATFGGPALDELFVTTGCMNLGQEQKPPAGSTFRVTGLGVKGHPNCNVKLDYMYVGIINKKCI